MMDYPFTVRHLSDEEGGGYLAEAYDLNGCIADGETIEEAIHNLQDAITSWIKTAQELGNPIPDPAVLRQRRTDGPVLQTASRPIRQQRGPGNHRHENDSGPVAVFTITRHPHAGARLHFHRQRFLPPTHPRIAAPRLVS